MMNLRHLWYTCGMALLAGLALAACGPGGTASSTSSATATATCPPTPARTFKQATGTVITASSTQMTVQTSKGPVTVTFTSKTRYSRQQTVTESALQDGAQVQVAVKSNSDGTYTAQLVIIGGAGFGGGTGTGGGGTGGGTGGRGSGSSACRTGRGGIGSGSGTGGGILSGAKVLRGKVSSVTANMLTITDTKGTDYSMTLDNTTIYSEIGQAQASDVQIGQAVLAVGQAASDGSITANSVTILLALPTTSS